jgi:hypothetical protein
MRTTNFIRLICLLVVSGPLPSLAQDQWPEKMQREMECLKQHGLIQGTVTEVIHGDAHFAPYYRETAIGGRLPSIRYNGQFVEGKTKLSPDIIKICNPNAELHKLH